MAAIAALAEWKHRVENVFVTKKVNNSGCYVVKMFLMGEQIDIVVDDYIPCLRSFKSPCFT